MGLKKYLILLGCCITGIALRAQHVKSKLPIDEETIKNWEMVTDYDAGISDDGHHFFYYLRDDKFVYTLVLQAVKGDKKQIFKRANSAIFLPGGKEFLFMQNDTLNRLNLKTGVLKKISNTLEPKLFIKQSLLSYNQTGPENDWVIENLLNGNVHRIKGIDHYQLSDLERFAVLWREGGRQISWFDINSMTEDLIWKGKEGSKVLSAVFDKSSNRLAFTVQEKGNNIIWCYDRSDKKVELKIESGMPGIPEEKKISSNIMFSPEGGAILFSLQHPSVKKAFKDSIKVDIWNFKDDVLQDIQLSARVEQLMTTFWYAFNLKTNRILSLNKEGEMLQFDNCNLNGYVMIKRDVKGRFWENRNGDEDRTDIDEFVSVNDGSRIEVPLIKGIRSYQAAPDGKHLFIWGGEKGKECAYTYSPDNNNFIKISSNIPSHLFASENEGGNNVCEIAGWIRKQNAILIYDRFDIWKLDLNGKKPAVNLTKGYGFKNKIKLRFSASDFSTPVFDEEEKVLVTAFNLKNKDNGYYWVNLNKSGSLDSISMKPWITDFTGSYSYTYGNGYISHKGFAPKRAGQLNLWLVSGQSSMDAPNFYLSRDLRAFERLTNYQPHIKVNWYRTELAEWDQKDGHKVQGVLYKPENFDQKKKYPVIIWHYRMLSHTLNFFKVPALSTTPLFNIPWFVSRGYLVLCPDVYITDSKGGSGPPALDATESAAIWLSKLPFVQPSKIGLVGHSQSGFQANYISANTNVFAAIVSGAGGADVLSGVFDMDKVVGLAPARMKGGGYSPLPWENPELTVKLSPMYYAQKMNTPLLLVSYKKDTAVPYFLSRQYFTALWRLNKPVWMLQYDQGNHGTGTEYDTKDFTLRLEQFFNHYLKGVIAPVWMTRGVPSYKKGVDKGLEPDIEGSKTLPSNPYLKN